VVPVTTVVARRRAPTHRTQAERRAASERRLLVATAELVVDRGLAGSSLAEIGARAGLSHALVTHLFGSKLGLVERLNDLVDEFYGEHIGAVAHDRRGVDVLAELGRLYLALVTGPDVLGRVHLVLWAEAIAGAADVRPSRIAWDRRFRDGITTVLRDGVADGSIRADLDPAAAAVLVVGLLRGVALQLLVDPSVLDLAVAQAAVVDAIQSLVQSAPGAQATRARPPRAPNRRSAGG
jgi:AcrR family transcriptional regulator